MFFSDPSQRPHWLLKRASACLALLSLAPLLHAQDQYVGAMMQVAGNFCPKGWMAAEGQVLQINQYQALFSLLGVNYGGTGITTFQLPDLRGRVPTGAGVGQNNVSYPLGVKYGSEQTTLTLSQLPAHTHVLTVPANTGEASHAAAGDGRVIASTANGANFAAATTANTTVTLSSTLVGGNQPISLMEPSLGVRWCIATTGIFPSRP